QGPLARPHCFASGALIQRTCLLAPNEGSRDPARTFLWPQNAVGRGSRLRYEPADKPSGAATAAIRQKGLPIIVWNVRLYAGITLRRVYFCKHKRRNR